MVSQLSFNFLNLKETKKCKNTVAVTNTVMQAGKGVIIKKAKNLKYVYLEDGKKEKMEKFMFPCKDLIGKPYGTAFKVIGRDLEVIDPTVVEEHRTEYEKLAELEKSEKKEVTQDNRDIVDSAETQKLDKKTIMGFRNEGMEGEKIVEKLIENSATFKDRTEFSQAKYLKKKEKKYLQHFVALRPTVRLLAEMYFNKAPDKILDMRLDTLAQILTYSNVQSGSKVLLTDSCKGLVMGAVLERLGLEGSALQIHQGNEPVRAIVEQLNFSLEDVERLACSFQLDKLEVFKELQGRSDCSEEELMEAILGKLYNLDSNTTKNAQQKMENGTEAKMEGTEFTVKTEAEDPGYEAKPTNEELTAPVTENNRKRKFDKKENRSTTNNRQPKAPRVSFLTRERRRIECVRAMQLMKEKKFDSLIIASKYHPKAILLSLLEYLQDSRPFVVYCQYQEPLMECYVTLKDMKVAVNVDITETWHRNVQVLTDRSHPEIVMSATGGYILRGIKVKP
ncbi:tRNA (adenine(58)-N(1))-methyltransferase non-catalytic subunit TRM6-like [Clytia hemisphaerica]|uniref:tRNA (adenine(58)-N(1))-methyltransferase non-catalytic subunit TRM6-like n=1 Tax=Clytia hemisphaerica TaxID=252671 RepID=UPI0034D5EBC6